MRFLNLSLTALVAMATSALAQTADFDPIYTPTTNQEIEANTTFTITWKAPPKYQNEKVSIHLIGGETQNKQVPLSDIDLNVDNSANSYAWKVDASLGSANVYGLVIKLKRNPEVFQYSMPFKIKGLASTSVSSTSQKEVESSTGQKEVESSTSQKDVESSSAPVSASTAGASNVTTTKLAALTSSALSAASTIKSSAAPIAVYPMSNCNSTFAIKPMTSADAATSAVERQPTAAATTSLARLPTSLSVNTSDATSVARASLMGLIGSIMVAVAML
ncbi:hypothetical protein CDD81_2978 [Ophiocordyceps australis]|uniref:Yeast cell wall synthesis Kre9/Knh1-like N-terminal domain-containing protein n=1 Tax=Ophiocordyceps australis TaxID=1399860 RepID=A0A2C5XCE4_9HYPO|nr:hypothetical protein CDD81_2978 [Ophiocordyceps australis]